VIKVINITKSFGNLQVLKGINIEIEKGKVISIVGASGAGKTTLLQLIGTLSKPTSGIIKIDEVEVNTLKEKPLAKFRNKHIGFVFQFHHLLPEFTALENVFIPALIAKVPRNKAEAKAKELLTYLNLDGRLDHKPGELSGGEQQKVAMARALINDPSIILADEPSGNLDTKNKKELHELIFSLKEKFNQTVLIATHDIGLANMSDKMLTLKDGVILS